MRPESSGRESAGIVAAGFLAPAALRRGWSLALYILLACAASIAAYALAVVLHTLLGELGFCAIASFFALRQYGEALARYDPI